VIGVRLSWDEKFGVGFSVPRQENGEWSKDVSLGGGEISMMLIVRIKA